MFCQKCGAQVPESAGFCYKCGAKLARVSTADSRAGHSSGVKQSSPIFHTKKTEQVHSHPGQSISKGIGPTGAIPVKKRPRIFVVIGLAGGFLLLLLVLIGIANVVQNQSSEQVDCQTEIILTETYTDEENGFSFQYPSSWKVVSKDSFTDYLDTSSDEIPLAILVNETEAAPEPTAYMAISGYPITKEAVDRLYINDEEFVELLDLDASKVETSVVHLDSVDARQIQYIDEDFYSQNYIYSVGLKLYHIIFACQKSKTEEQKRYFDAVIDSYIVHAKDMAEESSSEAGASLKESESISELKQSSEPPEQVENVEAQYIGAQMKIDCLTDFSNGRAWVQFYEAHREKGSVKAGEEALEAALGDKKDMVIYGLQNYHPDGHSRAALIDTTGKILWESDLTPNSTILPQISEFDNGVAYITFNGKDQEIYYIIDIDGNSTYARAVTDDFVILGSGDGNFLVAEHTSNFDVDEWQFGLMDRYGNMVTPYQTYEKTFPETKEVVAPPTGEMPDPNDDYWGYCEYQEQLKAYEEYANYEYIPEMIRIDKNTVQCEYLGEGKYLLTLDRSQNVVLDMINQRTLLSDFSDYKRSVPYFITDFENGTAYAMNENPDLQIYQISSDGTKTQITNSLYYSTSLEFSEELAFVEYSESEEAFIDRNGRSYPGGLYCNLIGEVVIEFPQFHNGVHYYSCGPFHGGYALMTIRGADNEDYVTAIDKNGNLMFEPKSGFREAFLSPDGKYITGIMQSDEDPASVVTIFSTDGTPVMTVEHSEGNSPHEVCDGMLHVADCYVNVEDGSTIGLPEQGITLIGDVFNITLH